MKGRGRRSSAAVLLVLVAAVAALSVLVWLTPMGQTSDTVDDLQVEERDDAVVQKVETKTKDRQREALERVVIDTPAASAASAGAEDALVAASPMARVVVRVIDEKGQPVTGVRTQLMCESKDYVQARSLPTDERGECVLSVSHELLKRRNIDLDKAKAYVELISYGSENPRRTVDLAAMPERPLMFRLADFGRIDVILPKVTLGFSPKSRLALEKIRELRKDDVVRTGSQTGKRLWAVSSEDEQIRAVPVALGKKWKISGLGGGGVALETQIIVGPQASGDTVRISMGLVRGQSWLTGTCVNEKQESLAKTRVQAVFEYTAIDGKRGHRSETCYTNERGEFLLELPRFSSVPKGPVQLSLAVGMRFAIPVSLGKDKCRLRKLELDAEHLRPGPHALGEIVLPAQEPLLSGVVLDDRGKPVKAYPQVRSVFTKPGGKVTYGIIYLQRRLQDRDGRFQIYGDFAGRRLALFPEPSGDHHVPLAPIMVEPGQKDIRIVLQRWGSLSMRLRVLSHSLGRSFFRLDLRREERPARRLPDPKRLSGDLLKFEHLVPGLYSLKVFGASDPRPCITISGLSVKPGEECKDRRLHPLDLVSLWRTLSIRITLPGGKPATRGFVAMPSLNGGLAAGGFAIEDGVARVLTMRKSIDLVVRVPGMLEGRLTNVASSGELQLEPGLERSIENPGGILPGHELVFAFRALAGAGEADDRIRVRQGASGLLSMVPSLPAPGADRELVLDSKQPDLRLRFTAPGRYRVYGQLRRKRDGACTTLQGTVKEIQVRSGRELTALALGLTRARIQAAQQKLPPTR